MGRPSCIVRRLHRVTYENGLAMQKTLVEMRQQELIPDQFLLLEHPPVLTLGKGRKADNLLATADELHSKGIALHETTRGGDITYHGPGQLVGYPLLHLGEGARDIRRYVTNLEEVLIRTLADFGIEAGRDDRNRGVWVGNDKIAAIGIRIARWVTSHGFALNIATDLSHYSTITPCGVQGAGVTSIEKLLGKAPTREEIEDRVIQHFAGIFGREPVEAPHELEIVKVMIHDGERVLLLHRNQSAGDFWQPVTGGIESGEDPADAAARELREEIGASHAAVESLGMRQSFLIDAAWTGKRPQMTDERVFAARIAPDHAVRLDEEEHDDWGWFSFEEAQRVVRWSDDRAAIIELQRRLHPSAKGFREQA